MEQRSERKLFQRFERRLLSQIGLLTGVSVLLPAAGPANAETETFSVGCGPATASAPGNVTAPSTVHCSATTTVTFDKFGSLNSTSTGTLTGVNINLSSTLEGLLGVFESAGSTNGSTGTWSAHVQVTLPNFSFVSTPDSFSFNCSSVSCNTASSMTFAVNDTAVLTGSAIGPYIGPGTVTANLAAFMTLTADNLGAGFAQALGSALWDPPVPEGLTVTYIVTPRPTVPEPGTLGLLGMGALAGLGFARRRIKQDT